ncbi:MAG: hypothetical protein AAGD09_26285, partial [Cyanobacteria bacterium P01_F01_bin.56]
MLVTLPKAAKKSQGDTVKTRRYTTWYVLKKEYLQQRNHVAKSLEFHKQSRRETLINQGLYFSLLVNCQ